MRLSNVSTRHILCTSERPNSSNWTIVRHCRRCIARCSARRGTFPTRCRRDAAKASCNGPVAGHLGAGRGGHLDSPKRNQHLPRPTRSGSLDCSCFDARHGGDARRSRVRRRSRYRFAVELVPARRRSARSGSRGACRCARSQRHASLFATRNAPRGGRALARVTPAERSCRPRTAGLIPPVPDARPAFVAGVSDVQALGSV